MRKTFCLLVVLLASCASGFGQSAPKLTTPQIVATFQRINQTKEIKPFTLYTPPQWGTFRISVVLVGTVANGQNDGFWAAEINYADAIGYGNIVGASWYTDAPRTSNNALPIRARAGKPLKFSVTPSGDIFGSKYNVWVVVEQLM